MNLRSLTAIVAALAVIAGVPASAQIPGPAGVVINQTPVQGATTGNCLYINGAVVGQIACGGTASGVTVGTSAIASGTTTRVLFDNAGVLGEYTNTQLTALINAATATLSGALPAWPNNTTTFFRGDGTYTSVANSGLANMANSTVKCRTTAGTGAPEDCTAAQTAAIIGTTGGALKSNVVNTTYNLTTASGTQDITGFGFDPTSVQLHYGINAAAGYGVGYASAGSATQGSTSLNTDNNSTSLRQTVGIFIGNAVTTSNQSGVISFITDGIRITWTKTGTPSGTLGITALGSR